MTREENYHDWLRDAHGMEKQAESMLEAMAKRIDNYPVLKSKIESHLAETREQIGLLEGLIDQCGISRSVLKDTMGKMAAMGQAVGGVFNSDEVVKGAIGGYVFEQFEIACYTSLIRTAEELGDVNGVQVLQKIVAQEIEMAEWMLQHVPEVTTQFLDRSSAPGVEAKK